jgi:catechol 2,3-dioxygenase-like lactoylglutathione lyase family enzyme
VAYRFGDQQLNVHGPGVRVGTLVARPPVVPGGSDLCFVWPGTVEEALAHLHRHRVDVEEGPVPRNGGSGRGMSVYFRDPDGSLLEFIAYGDPPPGLRRGSGAEAVEDDAERPAA